MYLISGDKAYGIIKLKEPEKIDIEEFEELRERHNISEEERNKGGQIKIIFMLMILSSMSLITSQKSNPIEQQKCLAMTLSSLISPWKI